MAESARSPVGLSMHTWRRVKRVKLRLDRLDRLDRASTVHLPAGLLALLLRRTSPSPGLPIARGNIDPHNTGHPEGAALVPSLDGRLGSQGQQAAQMRLFDGEYYQGTWMLRPIETVELMLFVGLRVSWPQACLSVDHLST